METERKAATIAIQDKLPDADPRVFEFLDAWRAARVDGAIPYRARFDPLNIPSLLKSVWLYQYEPGIGDFVCHLAGEEINEAWGQRINGCRLRQVVGDDDHDTVLGRWQEIVSRGFIQYGMARERLSRQQVRRGERILAPMKSDNGAVDVVLGMSLYSIGPVDRDRPALIPEDIVRVPCADL